MSISNFSHMEIPAARGRRKIYMTCQDHHGKMYHYGPINTDDMGYDPAQDYASIQESLEENLRVAEIESWLEDTEAIAVPDHAARPRYLSTWRARYKRAEKQEHRRLGYKMHREVLAGTFSNPQMNNAWNMTNPERNAFLTRVQAAHDGWVTLQSEVGE